MCLIPINMNTISKNLTTAIVAVIVIAGFIYAGQVECNDAISSGMSLEKYEYVKNSIGGGTRSAVVEAYTENREYYDLKYKEAK